MYFFYSYLMFYGPGGKLWAFYHSGIFLAVNCSQESKCLTYNVFHRSHSIRTTLILSPPHPLPSSLLAVPFTPSPQLRRRFHLSACIYGRSLSDWGRCHRNNSCSSSSGHCSFQRRETKHSHRNGREIAAWSGALPRPQSRQEQPHTPGFTAYRRRLN